MSPADVERLVKLMVAHGVTEIECDGVKLRRPLPGKPEREPPDSPYEQFKRLSMEAQAAALRGIAPQRETAGGRRR